MAVWHAQNEFFVDNPFDVKEEWWAYSWLCSTPVSPFFGLGEFGLSVYCLCFFSECLSNHCQGLRLTFPEICTKFEAVPLSDPSRNRVKPDTWLQKRGPKKISTFGHIREIFYIDFKDMLRTSIYRYIVLLQMLYRWQRQSLKLGPPTKCTSSGSHIIFYFW
jgi:hypothetical protein